jgi:hypothetical protein
MRSTAPLIAAPLVALLLGTLCPLGTAFAQRHSGISSPPTAPHKPVAAPILPVSSGLGILQFLPVNYGVPAPQSITRQLQSDDERTRASSLSALGAPPQYLSHGHIPYPRSVQLNFVALGNNDELDAILTIELDQHLLSAVLIPQDGDWHRIATVLFPTPFSDSSTTPSSFLHPERSLLEHTRYTAIYRGVANSPNGDFTENEAHLRVTNGKANIVLSFVSSARTCAQKGCDLTHRWLQNEPPDDHHATLITATGHLNAHDVADPLAKSLAFQTAHLRIFSCQPFLFNDGSQRFEPIANAGPCTAAH